MLAVRHEPASAAVVRHLIADDLHARQVSDESIADVILVASELIGNAVLHTVSPDRDRPDDLGVSWEMDSGSVTVAVADPSGTPPRLRSSTDAETTGRGLAIVAAIAADWGVQRAGVGKRVWARVPVH